MKGVNGTVVLLKKEDEINVIIEVKHEVDPVETVQVVEKIVNVLDQLIGIPNVNWKSWTVDVSKLCQEVELFCRIDVVEVLWVVIFYVVNNVMSNFSKVAFELEIFIKNVEKNVVEVDVITLNNISLVRHW